MLPLLLAVTLSWVDHANNEQGFYVLRRLSTQSGYSYIGKTGQNVTKYRDNGCKKNQTCCWIVQAYNVFGRSESSNEVCKRI